MSATLSDYNDALKQTWTQNTLESQIYDKNPFLEKIEKTSAHTIGSKATVPLKTSRNGGYSAVPSSGSSALNAAGNVGIDAADYTLTYHYQQVKIEHAAIVQTADKANAVANVIDTEMEGATSSLRKQLTRQLFGNGDALIAQCTSGGASTEVELLSTGFGYDAIVRRWLHPGLKVDIGTTANEVAIVADATIQSVEKSSSTPSITIDSSVTTTSSHYVSVANARAGTTSYECNGLRNIVSTSADLGTLTATGEWKAASVDSSTTTLTLDAMYAQQEAVMQETGEPVDYVLTSFKQQTNFYKLLQMQTRFAGDNKLGAGNVGGAEFAGMHVEAQVDCPNRQMWFLSSGDFLIVKGSKGAHWQSEYTGGDPLEWGQGTTAFVGVLMNTINVGVKRRNSHAALTALTA